uniref:Putative las1-like protein n=1 Tax=Anopheles triannulatus TaxID=58253 RepID=A0A2M4AUQ3_9DIPT
MNENIPEAVPACSVDLLQPDRTHISAWRDKSEFQHVYRQLFESGPEDSEAKEDALQWLNVWMVRHNKSVPVCVRCTATVLEAQLFDLRVQREDGDAANATEIKNIYAGAFTRFVNYVTEETQTYQQHRKRTIAQHVRGIGIEPFLVELRHLCAHRSVSIAIDVFRRSAQYCMDWLKVSYWQRELATMQPVTYGTLHRAKRTPLSDEFCSVLRTYDVATAGLLRTCTNVEQTRSYLTGPEYEALQAEETRRGTDDLRVIAQHLLAQFVRNQRTIAHNLTGVRKVCDAVMSNCRYLMQDPERYRQGHWGKIHSAFFRALAETGCLQELFERLLAVAESDTEDEQKRSMASFWLVMIGTGFQLLKEFKKYCRTLHSQRLVLFRELVGGKAKRKLVAERLAQEWYRRKLKKAAPQQLILGLTVDCPWHLRLDRRQLKTHLSAINKHTQKVLPILFTLVEPPLTAAHQQHLCTMIEIYADSWRSAGGSMPNYEQLLASKTYAVQDLLERLGRARATKKCGLWSQEPDEWLDWDEYPLGITRREGLCKA